MTASFSKGFIFPLAFFLILLASYSFAAITDLKIPMAVRLGENLTVSGNHGTAQILCKVVILDSNDFAVERLSDEYTFSDGTFYFQRQLTEPPYYRGDDFNVNITCGSDKTFQIFNVTQRLSLTHIAQQELDFIFDENNLAPLMMLFGAIGFIVLMMLLVAFFMKTGKAYAS